MSKKKIARKPRSTKSAAPKRDTRFEHARKLKEAEATITLAIRDLMTGEQCLTPVHYLAKASKTVGAVANFLESEVQS